MRGREEALRQALAAHQAGELAEAVEGYRYYLSAEPDNPVVHLQLGVALRQLGRLAEAEANYRQALVLQPDFAEAYGNLALCLNLQGRHEEAVHCAQQALKLKPDLASACYALGLAHQLNGNPRHAEAAYIQALRLQPGLAAGHGNLGALCLAEGRLAEAEQRLQHALALDPKLAEVHNNLGALHKTLGLLNAAEHSLRSALRLDPGHIDAHNNLAATLTAQGRFNEAEQHYQHVLQHRPEHLDAHSNRLYAHHFSEHCREAEHLALARAYGAKLDNWVAGRGGPYRHWRCSPNPQRLNVGLVSGDLRTHPVAYFLESLLVHSDPRRIAWHAYANHGGSDDEQSQRLRPAFVRWQSLHQLDAAAAARLIHDDGIHILIDLSGHTGGNALPLFAWQPAPVQATWLGYFATTGVSQIDYLITDPVSNPPGSESAFSERLAYLPDSRLCFTPPANAPDVGPLPAQSRGYLTFGSMQNPAKIGIQVIQNWGRILAALPTARLRLQNAAYAEADTCQRLREQLQSVGVAAERVDFHGGMARADYLAAHAEIDVILDTFPYPGGTTTCEALWMGVPTLTLAGTTLLGRQGASLLAASGLPEWIAGSLTEYGAKALVLAKALPQLAALRQQLRAQVAASPLCDAVRFVGHLESLLWQLWRGDTPVVGQLRHTVATIGSLLERAQAAQSAGRPAAALTLAHEAAQYAPDHPAVLEALVAYAAFSGDYQCAAQASQRLVLQQPANADRANNLGYFLQRLGRAADAETAFRHALAVNPQHADALNNYGLLLQKSQRLEEAEQCLRQALAVQPDSAMICSNLGDVLRLRGQCPAAEHYLRQALTLDAGYTDAHNNLGILYKAQGDFAAAEACYRQAIAVAPDKPLAWNNLANLQKELGQATAAEASYRQALTLAPQMAEARMNLGLLLLRQGRWAEGWQAHEARHDRHFQTRRILPPPLPASGTCPRMWTGECLQGQALLIWPEQGFGDSLQFVRFLPLLRAHGVGRITLACPPPLLPLLAGQGFADAVISISDWQAEQAAEFTAWTFTMSLPLHLGITLENLPNSLPYLRADAAKVATFAARLPAGGLRVGLAWRGNPQHKNDVHRSLPGLATLAPLWAIPGIAWVSLQLKAADEVAAWHHSGHHLCDWGGMFADFADSAAAISTLDLVICVDTAIAHLAGALGKPCWVILSAHDTDWRWLEDRDDSPWYPQVMRLFRQSQRDDWAAAIERLRDALQATAAELAND